MPNDIGKSRRNEMGSRAFLREDWVAMTDSPRGGSWYSDTHVALHLQIVFVNDTFMLPSHAH